MREPVTGKDVFEIRFSLLDECPQPIKVEGDLSDLINERFCGLIEDDVIADFKRYRFYYGDGGCLIVKTSNDCAEPYWEILRLAGSGQTYYEYGLVELNSANNTITCPSCSAQIDVTASIWTS